MVVSSTDYANTFTVDGFAKEAKTLIQSSNNVKEQQLKVKDLMTKVYADNSIPTIVDTLNAAVPPGANIAEMILYADDDITLLWGQIPPKFQSAVHNHTIWANILPIVGAEKNILFQEEEEAQEEEEMPAEASTRKKTKTIKVIKEIVVEPGQVLQLAPDAIHCIENPSDTTPARAFHVYGGNFKELDDHRDLWKWTTQQKIPFSFQGVMQQSLARMVASHNTIGLNAVKKAIPKLTPVVDKAMEGMKDEIEVESGVGLLSSSTPRLPNP